MMMEMLYKKKLQLKVLIIYKKEYNIRFNLKTINKYKLKIIVLFKKNYNLRTINIIFRLKKIVYTQKKGEIL